MNTAMLDGNEAAARVAYALTDICTIYPITPSSSMAELCDAWSAQGQENLWGQVPKVSQLQSEGGAAGSLHGALQAGALTTTFTASQGLLLMIPNMYKIAGELTPCVIHVSARSVAAQALSIFGDHSDVMATRSTGFAMLSSHSVQQAQDMAFIAHASSLRSRVPFLHFFDGFRTSHEINKVSLLDRETMQALINDEWVFQHRQRALSPDHPVLRGTAQNPDVFFQARERVNPFYDRLPEIVAEEMQKFGEKTGRMYRPFEYIGHPEAEHIVVVMGSASQTCAETVTHLASKGEKVGVIKVHLYRPFSAKHLLDVFPESVKTLTALDRTKEPGASGEPLFLDVTCAVAQSKSFRHVQVLGGRYGLSSKELTPQMVKATLQNAQEPQPQQPFTLGIQDDVTHLSLKPSDFELPHSTQFRGKFFGLGSDGTVGANKNAIKIIGTQTDLNAQAYFVYDSKKSGSVTISHLRFGDKPIDQPYLIQKANFIACHAPQLLNRFNILQDAEAGATVLLNTPIEAENVFGSLPTEMQSLALEKNVKLFAIDAHAIARSCGLGGRINTIMQTCFFSLSNILEEKTAIDHIKNAIQKSYGRKGENLVLMNLKAVDQALANLHPCPLGESAGPQSPAAAMTQVPEFVAKVTIPQIKGLGDQLPVSALPCDGTFPTATSQYEKRTIATEIPIWDPNCCIQCNKCVVICPHACIRAKVYEKPNDKLKNMPFKAKTLGEGLNYSIQVSPQDCTGCGLCFEICPAKNKQETRRKALNMEPIEPELAREKTAWQAFLELPDIDRRKINPALVKDSQFLRPLFEFSGACSGCGETPYVKLVSQLFGDRAVIANATGCSSIYGGNLPTTPWAKDEFGRGPAWSNSLFEDNAEFGYGMRLAIDQFLVYAKRLLQNHANSFDAELVTGLIDANQNDESDIFDQRQRVQILKTALEKMDQPWAKRLWVLADYLVKKSVWLIGGDGWAYDIGFGGLDQVMAQAENVNILVLDTEVYSNTGGQMSKSTPLGAVAKFAAGGKLTPKKDLASLAMTYGHVYVAKVAMGANDSHTVKAFMEAESYDGPSLILAYSPCIAHGINMRKSLDSQKAAVETGHWPLFRYDPRKAGQKPLHLDSKPPKRPLKDYLMAETRYRMLAHANPELSEEIIQKAQASINRSYDQLKQRSEQLT